MPCSMTDVTSDSTGIIVSNRSIAMCIHCSTSGTARTTGLFVDDEVKEGRVQYRDKTLGMSNAWNVVYDTHARDYRLSLSMVQTALDRGDHFPQECGCLTQ